jgi:hypothetical protein
MCRENKKYTYYFVRFEVLMAVSMKMAVFWVIAPRGATTQKTAILTHYFDWKTLWEENT